MSGFYKHILQQFAYRPVAQNSLGIRTTASKHGGRRRWSWRPATYIVTLLQCLLHLVTTCTCQQAHKPTTDPGMRGSIGNLEINLFKKLSGFMFVYLIIYDYYIFFYQYETSSKNERTKPVKPGVSFCRFTITSCGLLSAHRSELRYRLACTNWFTLRRAWAGTSSLRNLKVYHNATAAATSLLSVYALGWRAIKADKYRDRPSPKSDVETGGELDKFVFLNLPPDTKR